MLYILIILFTLSVSLSECFRFMERRKQQGQDVWKFVEQVNLNQLWHFFKGGYQLCFFGLVAYLDLKTAMVGSVVFWIFHDISTNIGLGVKWNYLGTTAFLDRAFGGFLGQAVTKISVLIISIIIYLKKKNSNKIKS